MIGTLRSRAVQFAGKNWFSTGAGGRACKTLLLLLPAFALAQTVIPSSLLPLPFPGTDGVYYLQTSALGLRQVSTYTLSAGCTSSTSPPYGSICPTPPAYNNAGPLPLKLAAVQPSVGTWTPSTAYAATSQITDPCGNVEQIFTAGTSGATTPTWPACSSAPWVLTQDGTAQWVMSKSDLVWCLGAGTYGPNATPATQVKPAWMAEMLQYVSFQTTNGVTSVQGTSNTISLSGPLSPTLVAGSGMVWTPSALACGGSAPSLTFTQANPLGMNRVCPTTGMNCGVTIQALY